MSRYLVFACPRCGAFRYAKEGQKTAKCFRCDHQTRLDHRKTRVIFRAKSREEAIEALQSYKMKIGPCGQL